MDFRTLNLLFKCGMEFGHKKIRNCGLSDTECMICSYAYSHADCSQDDVVQAFRMDKTTAAKALRALEDKGLIEREQDAKDKRKKILKVTRAGEENISAIMDIHDKWLNEILSTLSKEEQKQFESYCVRLLHAAENQLSRQNEAESKNIEIGEILQ